MKKLIPIVAALAVSLSFAHGADAEKKANKGAAVTPEERFKKLDTDGDGSISLEEFKAGPAGKKDPAKAEEIFKKKDKNGDGKLSLEEFSAGGKKKGEAAPAAPAAADPKGAAKDTAAPAAK
jgi:Ca2+-binding EF-hand superfamily protein